MIRFSLWISLSTVSLLHATALSADIVSATAMSSTEADAIAAAKNAAVQAVKTQTGNLNPDISSVVLDACSQSGGTWTCSATATYSTD